MIYNKCSCQFRPTDHASAGTGTGGSVSADHVQVLDARHLPQYSISGRFHNMHVLSCTERFEFRSYLQSQADYFLGIFASRYASRR